MKQMMCLIKWMKQMIGLIKWMKHLFRKKLEYVYKDFDTNLKTDSSHGNVFVKKEVFVTLSLQLKRFLKVFLKDFDTSFKGIFLKTHLLLLFVNIVLVKQKLLPKTGFFSMLMDSKDVKPQGQEFEKLSINSL